MNAGMASSGPAFPATARSVSIEVFFYLRFQNYKKC